MKSASRSGLRRVGALSVLRGDGVQRGLVVAVGEVVHFDRADGVLGGVAWAAAVAGAAAGVDEVAAVWEAEDAGVGVAAEVDDGGGRR